jgi:hypothetical protein
VNIDLSKMTHAVRTKWSPDVVGTFVNECDAVFFVAKQSCPSNWEVVPIPPPAPKYPEAERPTHCVQSPVGVTYVLGNESSCIRWKDKYGNEEYFVATCDHWWTNEGVFK